MEIIENLKQNRKSGLSVALVNIPLSISVAVASGATPLQGLLTGIWGGFFAAIFASSKHNVFGVAGALSSILLAFAITNGPELLPILAILSGIMIIIISRLKITKYIMLLPSTVLHGFLISVGLSIALGQISGALGLTIPQHKDIYMTIIEIIKNLLSTNLYALGMFAAGFAFLSICKKKYPNFPSVIVLSVIGVVLGYLVSAGFFPKVMLLSDKFHNLEFRMFAFPFGNIKAGNFVEWINIIKPLIATSFVIAIISILETSISAKIAEKMTKKRFRKNKEVFGLGMANLFSGLFGGLPATAVFIRTALNIKSGGTSKYSAGIAAVLTLGISALFLTGRLKYLPFPIIAAILINIALGLIDLKLLKKLYRIEKKAFYITLMVTLISVFREPTYGIILGTAISLIIFLKGVTNGDTRVSVWRDKNFFNKLPLCEYIKEQNENDIILLKFVGGLNYLNIENNIKHIEKLEKGQTIIISFSHMGEIDIDGFEALEEIINDFKTKNIKIYLSGISKNLQSFVSKLSFYKELVDGGRIIDSTSLALEILLEKKNFGD